MRFAHLADCHIGSWRDQKLKDISVKAFIKAVDDCIKQDVDFLIISGDLFNTAVPAIDNLKEVVKKLKQLKDKGIIVYGIAGSHDFSTSGKTMLDVLEHAGLFRNVFRGSVENEKIKLEFTTDAKTGAKITGIKGRKGMLDKKYYEVLEKNNLEEEQGFKIFLFHTAISELKPKELEKIESAPLSYLPKGFDYYAGGHVHYIFQEKREGYGMITYPGALFPANFYEIEKYGRGGYYLVDFDPATRKMSVEWKPVQILNTCSIKIDCNNKNPRQIEEEMIDSIKNKEFMNTIVTIRLTGMLSAGKPSDISFKEVFDTLNRKSAYFVMRSTTMLSSRDFKEVSSEIKDDSVEDVESSMISIHLGQGKQPMAFGNQENFIKELMMVLSAEKEEGEKTADFERRVKSDALKMLNID